MKLKAQASLPSFLIITLLILIVISTLGYAGINEMFSAERERNLNYNWALLQNGLNEALIRLARNKNINGESFILNFPFGSVSTTIYQSSSNVIVDLEARPSGLLSLKKRAEAILKVDSFGVINFISFKEK